MKASFVWAVVSVAAFVIMAAAQEGTGEMAMMPGIHYGRVSPTTGRASPSMERRRPMRPMRVPLNTLETSASRLVGEHEGREAAITGPIVFPDMIGMWSTHRVEGIITEEDGVGENITEGNGSDHPDEEHLMELPEDMDIESMGLDAMIMLSNVSTIEDYARLVGVELPDESPNMPALRFGRGSAMKAISANCEPENRTVVLDLPIARNVIYFPQCVRLQRCGGCCQGTLLSCQPTKVAPITLKLMRIEADMSAARSGNLRRQRTRVRNTRRRRNTVRYYTADEQHHIACSCQCRVKSEHCDPTLHTYRQSECMCRCNNGDEEEKCEGKSSTHYWDNKKCTCYCQKQLNCSTGEFYDHTSCTCQRNPVLLRGRNAGTLTPSSEFSNVIADINTAADASAARRSFNTAITFGGQR